MKVVLYLLVAVVALSVAAVFVLRLLFGDSPWPAAPPRVVEGGRRLGVVELDPKGLTINQGDGSWMVCRDFELRVSGEGGVESLLIRGTYLKDSRERLARDEGAQGLLRHERLPPGGLVRRALLRDAARRMVRELARRRDARLKGSGTLD
jgi:hypothetical protein